MRRTVFVLLPLAVAALAGCSSPSPAPGAVVSEGPLDDSPASAAPSEAPAAAPAPLDACALLPQQEAEALAGTPLDPAVPGNPSEPSCSYTGPVEGPTAQVEIYASAGAKKFYEVDVDLQHTFTDVPGIGDEAHEEENAIFFRKGTTWVAIRLVLLNDPLENVPRIEEAARAVAGRL
ncbi:DUF3558 family protein [Naasia aerilata]|uniref:DUF3558 domain-containing protein n=1 Tax=Naasia aerilata TaxID=1162966 RepID=A0ABN6XW77_9MICO|nr:DUF3558 family protein [Naasia aerilata]BDZ47633.1 hypothetical protein GCM10025866_35420 [Naasia aerilata]